MLSHNAFKSALRPTLASLTVLFLFLNLAAARSAQSFFGGKDGRQPSMKTMSVIIPALNEERFIGETLQKLNLAIQTLGG